MKFPKLVIEEAKALRKHATTEEKNKLDFQNLRPRKSNSCIYGQMTGSCWSERAIDLIQRSARRVYRDHINVDIEDVTLSQLNGSPKGKSRMSYWSPIEVFIVKPRAWQDKANEKLIKFIKGEIKSL